MRFIIIGDGHLRDELEAQARELGLNDDVMFTGTRNDPENFYPALDTVALTSLNEGTPLTLIEAMANARPVIATAVGGVVDLLGEEVAPALAHSSESGYTLRERGVLVRANNVEAFCDGLARLIDDEELRRATGARGQRFIEKHYSKDRLLADVMNLYRELAREKSSESGVWSLESKEKSSSALDSRLQTPDSRLD